MMFHAQHTNQYFQKILISNPDTDVFIICLSFQPVLNANLYFLTRVRNSRRIIDIRAVVENIYQNLSLRESLLSALIGFHRFTGCNIVRAFAGRGKIKPLMLMMKSKDYVEIFASFGSRIEMDDSLIKWLNRFLWHMYSWKGKDSVNNIRNRMYCQ